MCVCCSVTVWGVCCCSMTVRCGIGVNFSSVGVQPISSMHSSYSLDSCYVATWLQLPRICPSYPYSLFALFCEHNNYSDVPPAHLRISQHLTLWIGSVQTPLFVVVDAILRKSRLMCDLPCHRGRSGNQIGSFPTAWFWTRISGSSHCSCNCSVLVSLFSEPDPSHVE